MLLTEYGIMLILFLLATVIGLVILIANELITKTSVVEIEKLSAYECGFNPFNEARYKFDVSFYLVSILFIIFDIEIALLFPWSIVLGKLSFDAFLAMLFFLWVLTVGFLYEWQKKALEW